MKVITNKKEIVAYIGDWETDQIEVEYRDKADNLILHYKGETVKYINEDKKNVAWIAAQCGGITQQEYVDMFL